MDDILKIGKFVQIGREPYAIHEHLWKGRVHHHSVTIPQLAELDGRRVEMWRNHEGLILLIPVE